MTPFSVLKNAGMNAFLVPMLAAAQLVVSYSSSTQHRRTSLPVYCSYTTSPVDPGHGINNVLDVDGFGCAGPSRAGVGGRVQGEHDAGGDIGSGGAAAEDGLVEVLPEPGLELECDFAYLTVRYVSIAACRRGEKSGMRQIHRRAKGTVGIT